MALDLFVRWKDRKPTKDQAENVIRNFMGGAELTLEWKSDRFFVRVPGSNSVPYKGLGNKFEAAMIERYKPPHDGRCIEVWLGDDSLDVMTREADEFTNALAQGLAECFSRYWGGMLEVG